MEIDITRFHQTFFDESAEGLDVMESALLKLDVGNADAEIINTIFRAAHSIKGGAATFGFAEVAGFTHLLETLLDQMRSGQRAVTQPDVDVLLRSVDIVRSLPAAAGSGKPADDAAIATGRGELEPPLAAGSGAAAPNHSAAAAATATPVAATPAEAGWRIRFTPRPELFRSGNDPLRILRELAEMGALHAELDDAALPSLADADPEDCYLSWNLVLRSGCSQASLREVFAWVEDECDLQIEALAAEPPVVVAVASEPAAASRPAELKVIKGGRDRTETQKAAGDGKKNANAMCSKAATAARPRLLSCVHRRYCCTLECDRPPGAETAHEQGVDLEPACLEAAALRLGHEPGIGDPSGEPVAAGAGFGAVRRREGPGREGRRVGFAQPARQGQRAGSTLPGETLARSGSAFSLMLMTGIQHPL